MFGFSKLTPEMNIIIEEIKLQVKNKIGTVEDSDSRLLWNTLNARCNKCGLYDKLSDKYKDAVGE